MKTLMQTQMATLFRPLAAALLLFLVVSTVASADEISPTYELTGVITIVGQGANPPTQTVHVSFDFARVQLAGFTDPPFYYAQIMPGLDSYTTVGVLGSSSGGITNFIDGIVSYSPIGVGGAEIDITDDSFLADPFHSIGADLYTCNGNATCAQDFPFVEFTSYPISFTYTVQQVPESSTLLLIFTGFSMLLWVIRRRSLA
jgi:hypothetical protein